MIIFGAVLSGYAGVAPWAIGAAAIGLAAKSYADRYQLIRRANKMSLSDAVEGTLAGSLFNAVVASGTAYAGGVLFHLM